MAQAIGLGRLFFFFAISSILHQPNPIDRAISAMKMAQPNCYFGNENAEKISNPKRQLELPKIFNTNTRSVRCV